MILGQGTACSEQAIIAEYYQFLADHNDGESPVMRTRLRNAPGVMRHRIGKPLADWSDEDILALYARRSKSSRYGYNAFLAFLFFRGYRQASLRLIVALPINYARQYRKVLVPFREQLAQAQKTLGYRPDRMGAELNLLIKMLAVVHKPLAELTRAEFESFRDEYQRWYRTSQRQRDGKLNNHLSRLEVYLVHLRFLPPVKRVFKHEQHFARLQHVPIREAILAFMQWCDAKYQPSTIDSRRAALLHFFLWLQAERPQHSRLDDVTRPTALTYAQYLKTLREKGQYGLIYCLDLYRSLRLFYEFVIREGLPTSPNRNPFAQGDMPREPDPVPRYLADHEIRKVLAYCEQGATLKERTVVITLFHTGIRAAELAALQATDIVEVQGKWKLHIHQGKGLKDRLIPLTPQCLKALQSWQEKGWERVNDCLFTHHGRPWQSGTVTTLIRDLGCKLGIAALTAHRFRHTFAVALLNYGMRESALQKIMGHATLGMTLEYARILDQTVEQAFSAAVDQMREGPTSWVPSFFVPEDYSLFAEGNAVSWIRLPHGYCRRNLKLHCESDVKCLLCDRFVASPADLPRLKEMRDRFQSLGMPLKADVVAAQIRQLEKVGTGNYIPISGIGMGKEAPSHQGADSVNPLQAIAGLR
jgi:site-specific recombinase XerD